MAMTLVEFSAADLVARRPRMVEEYASEVASSFGVPIEQARFEAGRQLDEMLPDGVRTEGQVLRTAVDDGEPVGFLWIALPGTVYPAMAWLAEIEVVDGHRARGYGSRMIAAGEADLVERGVHRIGLHVFGHNTGARRLYERLGYRVSAQARAKVIEPVTDPVPLTPMTRPEYDVRVAALLLDDPVALTRDPDAVPGKARQVFDSLAPDGLQSEGTFFRTTPTGWVWFSRPDPRRSTAGMIHYLAVDEDRRGRGAGRATMLAVEAELAAHGADRVGLNVVATDPAAMRLVDSLGYEVVSQQMIKEL
ncbi:GNAT family N-acetyltransferase [Micromonosporaceae bacterium Da 78-11]